MYMYWYESIYLHLHLVIFITDDTEVQHTHDTTWDIRIVILCWSIRILVPKFLLMHYNFYFDYFWNFMQVFSDLERSVCRMVHRQVWFWWIDVFYHQLGSLYLHFFCVTFEFPILIMTEFGQLRVYNKFLLFSVGIMEQVS